MLAITVTFTPVLRYFLITSSGPDSQKSYRILQRSRLAWVIQKNKILSNKDKTKNPKLGPKQHQKFVSFCKEGWGAK